MANTGDGDALTRAYLLVRPSVSATLRLLAAIALAYVFVVVLMTASAQSLVTARLPAGIDYSEGYARVVDAARAGKRFVTADLAARGLDSAAYDASQRNDDAGEDFKALASPLQSVVERPGVQSACGVPIGTNVTPTNAIGLLMLVERCDLAASDIPAAVRRDADGVIAGRATLIKASHDRRAAFAAAQRAARDAEAARATAVELKQVQAAGDAVAGVFAPIVLLRERAVLGGGLFVQFPPSLLQIVLAFFSGTFGALLVTLVLVVYPNSPLTLTRPGGNYGERILLGGLIAVCVYIVLGGGTAVLGSSNDFASGSANFQAFSAIGVLAGMFSDRVAQWLSKRADVFYGDESPVLGGKPATPPLKQVG